MMLYADKIFSKTSPLQISLLEHLSISVPFICREVRKLKHKKMD